jgi:Bacteriophage head to tail connecting protein
VSYDRFQGDTQDDSSIKAYLMQLFSQARLQRANFEPQWEEGSALCWPEYRNTFSFGHRRSPGAKYTQYQVDTTGSIKAHRFMAVYDALVTPFNSQWSEIRAVDPYLQKQKEARAYFQEISRILWSERYRAIANFQGQNQQNGQALAVFGNMGMFVDELDTRPGNEAPGLRYLATGPGEIYLLQNHQGRIDGYIRHFQWTARQAYQRWPEIATEDKSAALKAALEKADVSTMFDFLEFVIPRTDYDPMKIFAPQGKPWASIYVSQTGNCLMEQSGYYSFPLPYGRYSQAPEEWYGRGPTQMVLGDLKTKNSIKEAYLKNAVNQGDPSYLLPDDGLFDFKAQAGQNVYGGINEDGKPLIALMPHGDINVTKEAGEDIDRNIDAAFLNDLFPVIFGKDKDGGAENVRQTIEKKIQQGIFLSPLARQYTEYCSPMVDREIDLLSRMRDPSRKNGRKFPDPPQVVLEAANGKDIRTETKFTSPLAQALDMPAIAGFMRTVEMANEVAQATGDKSVFYSFNFKRAIPGIAENQRVPEDWLSTAKEIAAQEAAAAAAAKEDARVKSLPGEAAIQKAQAISAKAQTGGNTGGTLSGTPEGGMPLMPGQTQPGGRAFGQPGQQ